jgi:hypothetical protein
MIATDSRPASPLCGEAFDGQVCGRYAGHKKGGHRASVRAALRQPDIA